MRTQLAIIVLALNFIGCSSKQEDLQKCQNLTDKWREAEEKKSGMIIGKMI